MRLTPTVHPMTLPSTERHSKRRGQSCCRQSSWDVTALVLPCFWGQQALLFFGTAAQSLFSPLLGKRVREQKDKGSVSCSPPFECSAGDHAYLQILHSGPPMTRRCYTRTNTIQQYYCWLNCKPSQDVVDFFFFLIKLRRTLARR